MTIKADYPDVCWEPFNLTTGQGHYHEDERWPHYKTRAECAEAIADLHCAHDPDDDPLLLVARPCFTGPCAVIVCDGYGCNEEFDYEGDGGMHFDPADPMPVSITECDWTIEHAASGAERHYCPNCRGDWCDDCGDQHHGACPDAAPAPVVIEGQEALPW